MNISAAQFLKFLLLYTLFLSNPVFGVSLFGDNENIIWSIGVNQHIKIVEQDDDKFGLNDHPVELQEKELSLALQALEIPVEGFFSSEGTYKHIFTIHQIKTLSSNLVTAFRNAKQDEDIIFALTKVDRKMLGLAEKRFLAGRAFYKDNKLNIIIGEYDFFRSEAFERAYDPSGRGNIPYNFNYGKRTRASKVFESINMNVTGVNNKKLNKLRHDWFVIDLKVAAEAYVAQKNKKQNPVTEADKILEQEAAKLAKQRREMRAEMARMRKEVQDISSQEPASARSIEERMATLDQLLDKKLITQEEYDNKRKEILSDI